MGDLVNNIMGVLYICTYIAKFLNIHYMCIV